MARSVKPTLARLVAMMDLRRHLFRTVERACRAERMGHSQLHLARTLFTAAIAAVMSTCDSVTWLHRHAFRIAVRIARGSEDG